MNVVNAGNDYEIYNNGISTFKQLPTACYDVNFAKMRGFYLTKRDHAFIVDEKIYGNTPEKVNKVMRSYNLTKRMNRNLGVLLSGAKGIGKSLFVRLLADECLAAQIPVVIVNTAIPGIASFLDEINQDVAVIFDEFEKTFADQEDWKPQDDLLTLFDGLNSGNKLFVVTCNDLTKLSQYMINRPGRFHYHFALTAPSEAEVKEYLFDQLNPQYHSVIDSVAALTGIIDLPYDYLRAIAFELNQGYSLKEVMGDLNITKPDRVRYDMTVFMDNGDIYYGYNQSIDFSNNSPCWCRAYKDTKSLCFNYVPSKAHLVGNEYIINEGITRDDEDYIDDDLPEDKKKELEAFYKLKITRIVLTKIPNWNNRFFAV